MTEEKKIRLVKNHFLFSKCILPWVPRSRTLHRPIVAVLDCSNPIEITTRYGSVEMGPLTTIRVLHEL